MTSITWTDENTRSLLGTYCLLPKGEGFFSSLPQASQVGVSEARIERFAAVAMVELHDNRQSRWVLIERAPERQFCGQWAFPGCVLQPGDVPLKVLNQHLAGQLLLVEDGMPSPWPDMALYVRSVGLEWFTEMHVPPAGHSPGFENSLVFSYQVRLPVTDVNQVELEDLQPGFGRVVMLAGIADIQKLVLKGTLCLASVRLWRAYWEQAV